MNNQVLFDKATYDKLLKEVPSYKLITPSVVSERLKVRGSLARKALDELLQKGKFVLVTFGVQVNRLYYLARSIYCRHKQSVNWENLKLKFTDVRGLGFCIFMLWLVRYDSYIRKLL